jgi:hypothetical protein
VAKPVAALSWLLFVGASVHVAATAWFYTVPEVRAHMSEHRGRYAVAPAALIVVLAAVVPLLPDRGLSALLLVFFAWQFWHFQKQNLGVAALAASADGAAALSKNERRALMWVGVGGIVGLLGHPDLLQITFHQRTGLLFAAGAVIAASAALFGIANLAVRPATARPPAFVVLFLSGLLFFLPVFVFASPYAAVAGLTIAHGLQYLLLVTLLAASPGPRQSPGISVLVLMNIALILGLVLSRASHLHDAEGFGRAFFGAYLGLTAAHFVIDAGLWRLRDEFPRTFLRQCLPYLIDAPGS